MLINVGKIGIPDSVGGKTTLSSLFKNGEDGYLFRNFSNLSKVYTLFSGPPAVVEDNDPVGLILDESLWNGLTLSQIAALSPELKETGAVAMAGTAPANSYNTGTGAGTASRVDLTNQSYVSVPVTANNVYLIDITPTNNVLVKDNVTGASAHTFLSSGGRQQQIVRPVTNVINFLATANGLNTAFTIHSIKRVPGNHAAQSTAARRPTYRAPSQLPPSLQLDGSDDALLPLFRPMVSGTGLTMAMAFYVTDTSGSQNQRIIMGGGDAAARATIIIGSTGSLGIGWGTQVNRGGAVQDLRNGWHVIIVTGESSNRSIWLDGKNITSEFAAASGTPGTGGPIVLGGRQTAVGGAVDQNMTGNISAALALDRRVTEQEINLITTEFRKSFTIQLPTLSSILFGGSETGFLLGNFKQKDQLFTLYSGPPRIAIDTDPVGLALDNSRWSDKTLPQIAFLSPELKATGTTSLIGTATAATYDTSTGVGSVTRAADGGNQSSVTFAVSLGDVYFIDITPLQNVIVRDTATGVVAHTFNSSEGRQQMAIRPATTTIFFQASGNSLTANFTLHSIKRVPGTHLSQATSANRPFWRISSTRRYLSFDGSNDLLQSSFIPTASSTLAIAFNTATAGIVLIGGGSTTGNKRCYLGTATTTGQAAIGWGTEGLATGYGDDIRNTNAVLIATSNGTIRNLYLNGNLLSSLPINGGPDGTGGGVAVGGWNNSGTPQSGAGNVYAALALNRFVTASEVSRINDIFQRTFV